MSAKQGRDLVKQHFVRDQTDAAVLLNLMRLYAISVLQSSEADTISPAQQAEKLEKAMLLADQFCLGD